MNSIVDAAICITLTTETSRQHRMTTEMARLGIAFSFFMADRHPLGGCVGSFESHVNVWIAALERGYDRVLILEDDVLATPGFTPHNIKALGDFMASNLHWEMIQLGCGPALSHNKSYDMTSLLRAERVAPNIYRHIGLQIHAYVLSRNGLLRLIDWGRRRLLQSLDDCVLVDRVMLYDGVLSDHGYTLVPFIFDQDWCIPTSNVYDGDWIDTHGRRFYCESRQPWFYFASLLTLYRFPLFFLFFLFSIVFISFSLLIYRDHSRSP